MALGNRGGRPPKPTALKVLQGTARPHRMNTREPTPPVGTPAVPSWLSARARVHWRRLAPLLESMGVLTVADGVALAMLADVLAEYVEARAMVSELGATYETPTGPKPRPDVAIASSAWTRARAMLAEFGLTPSSRSRLHVGGAGEEERDPLEELLRGGGQPS